MKMYSILKFLINLTKELHMFLRESILIYDSLTKPLIRLNSFEMSNDNFQNVVYNVTTTVQRKS